MLEYRTEALQLESLVQQPADSLNVRVLCSNRWCVHVSLDHCLWLDTQVRVTLWDHKPTRFGSLYRTVTCRPTCRGARTMNQNHKDNTSEIWSRMVHCTFMYTTNSHVDSTIIVRIMLPEIHRNLLCFICLLRLLQKLASIIQCPIFWSHLPTLQN